MSHLVLGICVGSSEVIHVLLQLLASVQEGRWLRRRLLVRVGGSQRRATWPDCAWQHCWSESASDAQQQRQARGAWHGCVCAVQLQISCAGFVAICVHFAQQYAMVAIYNY